MTGFVLCLRKEFHPRLVDPVGSLDRVTRNRHHIPRLLSEQLPFRLRDIMLTSALA
jgi:hypothetical protein